MIFKNSLRTKMLVNSYALVLKDPDYRRAQYVDDFKKIVELQNKNLLAVLTEEEKNAGFLSTAFTVEQFQAMNDELCIITCFDKDKLCGFSAASSLDFNKQIPLIAKMIKQFQAVRYKSKELADYK